MGTSKHLAVVVGASQGIGEAIAVSQTGTGRHVVVAARDEVRLQQVARTIEQSGGTAHVSTVDVADPADIARFAAEVVDRWGVPRVLVAAAGNSISKPALEVSVSDWDHVHTTHLRGTFFLNVEFARFMIDHGYGKIVNLSSTWSQVATGGRSVYAAAKAGVSHMTASLGVEWAPYGVRVNAVAPGVTLTPRTEDRFARDPTRLEYHLERIPIGRIATTGDIVGTVDFLTSPASDMVVGQTIVVDGGFTIGR